MRGRVFAGAAALVVALVGARGATALDSTRPVTDFTLTTWGERDGLPNTTVQDLAQTPDGYLWIATLEGLVRFDGSRFTTFDRVTTPEIPRNDIQTLLVTRGGELWLASYGGGLVHRRRGVFERPEVRAAQSAQTINAIAEGESGELWVGTGTGLLRLEGASLEPGGPNRPPFVLVDDLAFDARGTLWLATPVGAFRIERGHALRVPLPPSVEGAAVRTVAPATGGAAWLGTDRGLVRFAEDRPTLVVSTSAPVKAVMADRHGGVWFGAGDRLGRLHNGRLEWLTVREGLAPGVVVALLEDQEGSLWVGSAGGLTQVKEGAAVTLGAREGLEDPQVLAIAPSRGGGFHVGTAGGELFAFDGRRFRARRERLPFAGSRVLALLDEGERLFVGTDRGLFVRTAGEWHRELEGRPLPRDSIRSLLRDARGTLWIGTDGAGLHALAPGPAPPKRLTVDDGLPSNQVRGVLFRRDGTLVVATYGGLAVIRDAEVRQWAGLSEELVRSLHEDEEGVLWVGTYGGGLVRIEGGQATRVTAREGLLSDVIYGIVDDGARLWMSCNRGIFAVSKSQVAAFARGEIPRVASEAYGREDGLRTEECSGGFPAGVRDGEGRLWFATGEGVVCLDPARRALGRRASSPLIEEAVVSGQAVATAPTLVIPPGPNRLELSYTSVSFSAAQRTSFSYRMAGFDSDWVLADRRRHATYTNLPPGTYRFVVRARAAGGDWRESEAPLEVVVKPHWHETAAFRLALIVGVPLGLAGAYAIRVRGLKHRERELVARVEEAVAGVKVLRGLLPICAGCKRIRANNGYWNQIEAYIRDHTEADFSHGLCPECVGDWFPNRPKRAGS